MGEAAAFYAIAGSGDVESFSWADWHVHPSVFMGLLLLGGAYLYGSGPLRKRYNWASQMDYGKAAIFFLSLAVIFLALQGPLHELSDHFLFSAHMVQHLLISLVFPPLLLLGTPGWLLRPLVRSSRVRRWGRLITHPVMAFSVFNVVLIAWHLPGLYDLTLRDHSFHILEHLTFLAAGVIACWPLLSPIKEVPRAPYPVQMLYIFGQSVPMGFLGAIITFSQDVLYPFYAEAPRVWAISPLTDQQIGGMIMKSSAGIIFLLALGIVFFVWAGREEQAFESSQYSH